MTSTQMDASESLAALKVARELDTTLLDAATAQHALSSTATRKAQKALMLDIDPKDLSNASWLQCQPSRIE